MHTYNSFGMVPIFNHLEYLYQPLSESSLAPGELLSSPIGPARSASSLKLLITKEPPEETGDTTSKPL
jgi:hypothetical protein